MAAKLRLTNWLATSLAIASVVVGSSLFAQSTWTGLTNGNWATSTNWSGGVPATNGTVTLPVTPSGNATRFAISLPATTNAISSLTAAAATSSNVYSLSTGTLVLADGATITNGRRTSLGGPGLTIANLSLSGSATVGGAGVTRITAVETSVGATSLSITGTVQVTNGNSDIVTSVQSGGTLRYLGTDMGPTTIKSGGSLTPVSGDPTTANFTSLTLENGSNTTARVVYGAANDMPSDTITSGSTAYGGTLNLNFAGVGGNLFDSWTTSTIFGGSTKTGDFTNVVLVGAAAPYAGLTFNKEGSEWKTASFTGQNGEEQWLVFQQNTGNLVVVPEPSTIVFAGVGVAMAGWSAWKKRRLSRLLAKA